MLRLFNFVSDSKLDLAGAASIIFTPKVFVVRPFRVVHEAKVTHKNLRFLREPNKASHYTFRHSQMLAMKGRVGQCL